MGKKDKLLNLEEIGKDKTDPEEIAVVAENSVYRKKPKAKGTGYYDASSDDEDSLARKDYATLVHNQNKKDLKLDPLRHLCFDSNTLSVPLREKVAGRGIDVKFIATIHYFEVLNGCGYPPEMEEAYNRAYPHQKMAVKTGQKAHVPVKFRKAMGKGR